MSVPKVPTGAKGEDARSEGGDPINATTPPEQRVPDLKTTLDAGPKLGPTGNYQRARYKTAQRLDSNGKPRNEFNIREDR